MRIKIARLPAPSAVRVRRRVGSRHYDDGVEAWLGAGYHPLLWERVDVVAGAVARLSLLPAGVV